MNSRGWYDGMRIDKGKKNAMNGFGINAGCEDKLEMGIGLGGLGIGNKINGNGGIMINRIVRSLIKGKEN
nr:hypothetical protein [Staphylococcus epidermidis]